jgi:hypothetical protein
MGVLDTLGVLELALLAAVVAVLALLLASRRFSRGFLRAQLGNATRLDQDELGRFAPVPVLLSGVLSSPGGVQKVSRLRALAVPGERGLEVIVQVRGGPANPKASAIGRTTRVALEGAPVQGRILPTREPALRFRSGAGTLHVHGAEPPVLVALALQAQLASGARDRG